MTVNKDEIRRLDADKLLEWIRSNRSFTQSMMDTAVNERMKRLASEIESGTFDAPPDAKDAEIERLRKANELERRMYHELRAEWQKSEEARKAAEQHAVELAKQVLAAEQERDVWKNRHEDAKNDRDTFAREMNEWRRRARCAERVAKAAAETAWGLDKERVELQQQLAELKKKVETYAAKNATLENDNRYLQEQHRLAAELATEQRYAKEQAIKWNDEVVRMRQQNAAYRECLEQIANETLGTQSGLFIQPHQAARTILNRYKEESRDEQ